MPVLWQSKNEFELFFKEIGSKTNSSYNPHHQPSEEPQRLSSAPPACTEQHSPSYIQPECGETAELCSRVAESLIDDGQCCCAAALLTNPVVVKGVAMRLLMCLEKCEHVNRSYRQERLVEMTRKTSMTTSRRRHQQPFEDMNDLLSKEVGEAQKIIDIERVMALKHIPAQISTVQWCSCSWRQVNTCWRD